MRVMTTAFSAVHQVFFTASLQILLQSLVYPAPRRCYLQSRIDRSWAEQYDGSASIDSHDQQQKEKDTRTAVASIFASMALLDMAVASGFILTGSVIQIRHAIAAGCLAVLQRVMYMNMNAVKQEPGLCTYAARHGRLDILQWLRMKGCPWNSDTCKGAAENGHLEVLKWAREHNCPWNEWTCASAAENGHLEILKWARQPMG